MKWTEDFVYGPVFREISERPLDVEDQVLIPTLYPFSDPPTFLILTCEFLEIMDIVLHARE